MDLQGKLARWRDDQGKRSGSPVEPLVGTQKVRCNCKPVGDGLARSGLRRNKKVVVDGFVRKHGNLYRGRPIVVALG